MQVGYNKDKIVDTNQSQFEYVGNLKPAKKLNSPDKYTVFHVEGGLGKNVAATAIVRLIKEKHQDRLLIVVASYPEVFLNNPNVHRVYRVGFTPYFYDDFILDKDVLVFRHEPYFQTDHILKKKQLIQNWAELYDLNYKKSIMPELYMNMVQDMSASQWVRQKPIMVLHTNGGFYQQQRYTYAWTRDMPVIYAEEIVKRYGNDYHIIQICREKSQELSGVEGISRELSNMELFSLLRVSQKRILIDSCLQHAAAALNLPSVVLWVGTSPKVFGYDLHKNITANIDDNSVKLIDSYLFDFQFDGLLHECPIKDMGNMFNFNEIISEIDKI